MLSGFGRSRLPKSLVTTVFAVAIATLLASAPPARSTVTSTISIDGSPVTVTVATAGDDAAITFSGTAGQQLGLAVTNDTIGSGCCGAYMTLKKPDGFGMYSAWIGNNSEHDFELPVTGTYTIFVDPAGTNTGSATFTLSQDVVGAAATVDGASGSVTTSRVGQNGRVTFSGTAGQQLGLAVTSGSFGSSGCCGAYITVRKPDGFGIYSAWVGTDASEHDLPDLPVTGTYTIFVDPAGTNTGSGTFTLSQDAVGTAATVDGASGSVTTSRIGQNGRVTFTGTVGQHLGLAVTNGSFGSSGCCGAYVTVRKPDGFGIYSAWVGTDGSEHDLPDLPVTGTYTIFVDPAGTSTGSATFTLSKDADGGSLAIDGSSASVTTTRIGQNARFTFQGTAGQHLGLGLTAATFGTSTCCGVYVTVRKPDGFNLLSQWVGTDGGESDLGDAWIGLPATGTYTVFLDPDRLTTGSATLTLSSDLAGGEVVQDGDPVTTSVNRPGQNERYTFSGSVGDDLNIQLFDNSFACCNGQVSVFDPTGKQIVSSSLFATDGEIQLPILAASGTYTIFIDPPVTSGAVSLAVNDPPKPSLSFYMPSTSISAACNLGKTAAQDAKYIYGAIILHWGRPAYQNGSYGTLLQGTDTFVANSNILDATESFAQCFYNNAPSQSIVLAMGVNNYHKCPPSSPCSLLPPDYTTAGQRWGNYVNSLGTYLTSSGYSLQIVPAAADDAEPAYDASYTGYPGFETTHDFIAGYGAVASWYMFDYGSMESGYWTPSQEYFVAYGQPNDFPFPQVYFPGMASEWGKLDLWAIDNGKSAMWFKGVLDTYPYTDPATGQKTWTPRTAYMKMLQVLQTCNFNKNLSGNKCTTAERLGMYQKSIAYLSNINAG